ncbi:MAG: alpha/beta hydrolase [Solirubrobacterales bacterium]|nr:alpha/beta hydrolase [Solirubrobacterales bacterium]
MPGWYLQLVAIIAVDTGLVLWPPRRPRGLAAAAFFVSHLVNELSGVALGTLLGATVLALIADPLASAGGAAILALMTFTALGLLKIVRRGLMAGPVVETALDEALGRGWRSIAGGSARSRRRRLARSLVAPLPVLPLNVQRVKNVTYGPGGRRNRLDVYRRRGPAVAGAPVLIHFHGGHFEIGRKSRECRPLLHRLARQGWVCVSATYRLGAAGRFPNSLIDANRVICWARSHAAEYGADPSVVIVAGSSAGAHLAAMAALTPNDPAFQPGFEHADTAVSAAICLYGYYGERDSVGPLPSSPGVCADCNVPPFLVAHGDNDVLIPKAQADQFVHRLRTCGKSPVVYVPLPGAGHSFDLFHSPRFEQVIYGVEAFTAWVRLRRDETPDDEHPVPHALCS